MAVYAVGDIQGCYKPLRRLLDKAEFDPVVDTLWCVGDLVNRGPDSLAVLRYLKSLDDACVSVLGNHDLHLLERACGGRGYKRDTFDSILHAKDSEDLLYWLRQKPLMHSDTALGWSMVHAGLHPHWSMKQALQRAEKVSKVLRGDDWQDFCRALNGAKFPHQEPEGDGLPALIFTTAVLTRTRYCTEKGIFNWHVRSGEADGADDKPWFNHKKAAWRGKQRVVYGHWAAKGLVLNQPHVLGLDSGCVWGRDLTLARLDGQEVEIISVSGLV